jgi:DNA transformation protein and related proteins
VTSELAALRNLGPVSVKWLEAVGVHTVDQLRALGAVEAYHRIAFSRSGDVSLNLLYALHGALTNVRWDQLPLEERQALRLAADKAPDSTGPIRKKSAS